jgi:hypothetical protein
LRTCSLPSPIGLAPVLGEPDGGYEPVPPPTVPPGGDSATTALPDAAAAA